MVKNMVNTNVLRTHLVLLILVMAGSVRADGYLFNRLAAEEIREGWNQENFIQMREGARRCGAVIVLASEFGWIEKSKNPQHYNNLSYKGISSAAIYDWYFNAPESEISPASIKQARAIETDQFMFLAEDYANWLSINTSLTLEEIQLRLTDYGENPPLQKLPTKHVFMQELTECYEVGLDLNELFSS